MSVLWPSTVNKKAYSLQTSFKDNLEKIEFDCGKTRSWLKNSTAKKTFSFSLKLEDYTGTNSEYKIFLAWYNEVLLSGSESFYFTDLSNPASTSLVAYRMTAVPSATGQKFKIISLQVEEE